MKSHFAVFCIVRAEFLSIWRGSSSVRVCKRLGSIYVEAKTVPVRAMKLHIGRKCRNTTPLITNLGTGRRWVGNVMPRLCYPRERTPI